jgi:hypothetical protein
MKFQNIKNGDCSPKSGQSVQVQIDQRKVDSTFCRFKILSSEFRPPFNLLKNLSNIYLKGQNGENKQLREKFFTFKKLFKN